ncbi:antibiotic biosynthesis monooxygenase [Brucella sp. BO3]|uniref:Antibiotic biosynthesis monooxygenase n=1 Tax=Brucella inopinata TaxID=1218315 RepID=A0AAW7BC59_9HYPH|nr:MULTISPECIES: antibiotic biosynthesis monooxygenase [Brucella]KEY03894.1 antibiotic biosynthesis monooxygenase [Brucella suis bv. 4 str. 40]EFM55625.1 antibiotic biosynthesis monooxygenase protein [Brucella inopinata BO1]MDL2334295.1 antibiotic biosynthesis monooxygenase [Brucella inopinata]OEI84481.1 antibiotic biosynthesis monooxygenase [Brucella sp. B13-0095]QMV28040.1 antibiotic biosynthesis monooxygenase [Brucella sp. BO3]
MFIAMNRFKVCIGSETDFETVWKNRDSQISDVPGFESFHLLRGVTNEDEGYTLYASHTVWRSQEDFIGWTRSEQFRHAHRNAGENKPLYLGSPQFEGFTAILGQ